MKKLICSSQMKHYSMFVNVFFVAISILVSNHLDGARIGGDENCTCFPYCMCNDTIDVGKADKRFEEDTESTARYGEFPWMVAVLQKDSTLQYLGKPVKVYLCGGSLIHHKAVITAAHCISGKNDLLIRAGEWDTQHVTEPYPTQDRLVSEVIVQEGYREASLANDVALLILEEAVDTSTPNVGLVQLPGQNELMDGRECVATGWGKDQFGKEGRYQVILKKVKVPIVARETCLRALRKTRLGPHFYLHESFICAGGKPGRDTCKGDGGSPLVCPSRWDPKVFVQGGVVAWGIGCKTETPGVYVNVAKFVDWIDGKLRQRGILLRLSNVARYQDLDSKT